MIHAWVLHSALNALLCAIIAIWCYGDLSYRRGTGKNGLALVTMRGWIISALVLLVSSVAWIAAAAPHYITLHISPTYVAEHRHQFRVFVYCFAFLANGCITLWAVNQFVVRHKQSRFRVKGERGES